VKDWCRPGQRVVCIADNWCVPSKMKGRVNLPIRGIIYTIRDVEVGLPCKCAYAGIVALSFEECRNDVVSCCHCSLRAEVVFWSDYFRPVRDTSIEDLRSLLNPTPDQVGRVRRELVE
jgi:hypothetical protein